MGGDVTDPKCSGMLDSWLHEVALSPVPSTTGGDQRVSAAMGKAHRLAGHCTRAPRSRARPPRLPWVRARAILPFSTLGCPGPGHCRSGMWRLPPLHGRRTASRATRSPSRAGAMRPGIYPYAQAPALVQHVPMGLRRYPRPPWSHGGGPPASMKSQRAVRAALPA